MPLAAGTKLGPFEILAPIGAGGMGEVYRARDARLDRIVAVKTSREQFSRRFEQEARAVAALNHSNICTLYDVGPDYLIMEYIEGAPLQGPLPVKQALKYAVQICDALDAAHRKGITHRDLKPANILVTKSGIKLLDFGVAKQRRSFDESDATQALTQPGTIIGTLNYMSPEQLQSREADARSDIFSFGLVLYEMLTGKRAFEGASAASTIAAIMERPAPSLAGIAPPALDHVLQTCLAKDPEERWQSVRDLKRELEWIAAAPAEPEATKPEPRRLRFWLVPVTVLLVAAALSTGWLLSHLRPRASTGAPRLKLVLAPPSEEGGSYLVLSPDGTRMAFSTSKGLYVRSVDSTEAQRIAAASGPAAWSPDGRFLLIYRSNELIKVPLAGGTEQIIASNLTNFRGAAWTIEKTILYSEGGPLLRISESGGTPDRLTSIAAWSPTMLPDGRHYLFLSGEGGISEEAIYVGSLDSNVQPRKLTEANSKAEFASGHLLFLRGTTLIAQPFDASGLRVYGEAVPIASDIGLTAVSRFAMFSAAANGLISYVNGSVGRTALTWFDRGGNPLSVIDNANFYWDVAIAPDGKSVAATRLDPKTLRVSLWVHDIARGVFTRLASEAPDIRAPAWSPDATRIAYDTSSNDAYVRDAAGSNGPERAGQGQMPNWSPDGQSLALVSGLSSGRVSSGLAVLPMSGNRRPVTYLERPSSYQPTFSPDGRWMAYVSDQAGEYQVFVESYPAGHGKWQISMHGGAQPVWSRNGKELFFLSLQHEQNGHKIMAVPLKIGSTFEAGAPKELFTVNTLGLPWFRRQYSVTPDGQRFLVNVREDTHPQTILLQNWLTSESK